MSISSTLSNAFSGLTASARGAEVVSNNLANTMTDGYGRRVLELSNRVLGPNGAGVRVNGVARLVDQVAINDRRLADADIARDDQLASFFSRIESSIGEPGSPGSLSKRLSDFEGALNLASSRPDSETRLQSVLDTANALTSGIHSISQSIQDERMSADAQIATQVEQLNSALSRIVELNRDIRIENASGRDATSFMDERQRLIDQVSSIVPVREIPRDHGQIALFTTGGAVLLDGLAGEIGFSQTITITPDMTQASGALSGLTLRGLPVDTAASSGILGGGSLGALFSVRDTLAVDAQSKLDGFARDLMERFEDPSTDPTRAPGAPGLFTDSGSAFNPLDEIGVSHRLQINALADPNQGGALWRLRDGLGAVAPGPVGQAAGLDALAGALTALRPPASGGFINGNRTSASLAAELLSNIGTAKQNVENERAYSQSRRDTLKSVEQAAGVDTDQELQQLLIIEQAYSANARIVSAAEEMLDQLMAI